MSTLVYRLPPAVQPLRSAAFKLWTIRRLLAEGALDPLAADTALRALREHPNGRVAGLARQTTALAVAAFDAAPTA